MSRRADAVEVVAGLWIGAAPTARQAQWLRERGIDAVIDLRAERNPDETVWPLGFRVITAELRDHGTPSAQELEAVATTVRDLMAEGRTVFVHCRAGLERSPTVACAALMLQGWTLSVAYHRVVGTRKHALPTDGQLAALHELQTRLGQSARR